MDYSLFAPDLSLKKKYLEIQGAIQIVLEDKSRDNLNGSDLPIIGMTTTVYSIKAQHNLSHKIHFK